MLYIQDLKKGNHAAFNEVFNIYHRQIYNYVASRTNSEYYAEEVVQLTFIKLWKLRKKLSDELPVEVQLFRMAKTSLIDLLRIAAQKARAMQLVDNGNLFAETAPSNVEYKEFNKRLAQIIESLPPVRRQVFEMSRFRDMSHKEISKELQIAPKTVENHINLALKYLRLFFTLILMCSCIY